MPSHWHEGLPRFGGPRRVRNLEGAAASLHSLLPIGLRPRDDNRMVDISFIIPAFNEEAQLGLTLAAIHRNIPDKISFEILVVDNGSTDRTAETASAGGAEVLFEPHGTIGSVRNHGARNSRGRILVFIDADVVLGANWGHEILGVLDDLDADPQTLAGGMCIVPDNATLIQRVWFRPRETYAFSHLGTGHLITNRDFFLALGGFDESLETGEDYEFSRRAVTAGGSLVPTPHLVAEHHGFPSTLGEFIRREAWHGRSDFMSLEAFFSSKVAMLTALVALGHLALVTSLVGGFLPGVVASLATVLGICSASAWVKYRGRPLWLIGINAGLYYAYFFARFLAGIQALSKRPRARRTR